MEATHSASDGPRKLNDLQITLIKLFNRDMTDQESAEVRKLILDYYDSKLDRELNKVVTEKGYTQQDYDMLLNQQNRTEINQQIRQRRDAGSH